MEALLIAHCVSRLTSDGSIDTEGGDDGGQNGNEGREDKLPKFTILHMGSNIEV